MKALHCVFEYGPSKFDILTPTLISIESFGFSGKIIGREAGMLRAEVMTQRYGAFSKFDVNVEETVKEPVAQQPEQ